MEQRWARRFGTRCPIRLETSDGRVVGAVIRNISMGGFFVETALPLDQYACVDVCVRMPDASGWHIHKVPAVVTNTRPHGPRRYGAGLMFSAIDRRMRSALGRLTSGQGRESLRFDGLRSMGMPSSAGVGR